VVEEAHPDLSELHEAYQTLRAYRFAVGMKPLFEAHRDKLKPDVIWNIKKGLAITVEDLIKAENARAAMTRRMVAFFETYDLLLTPATIVGPFPIEKRFVGSCASVPFGNYIQWLAIAFAITITSMPALSLPCGFTAEGLPVGLQMVGPPRGEGRLLAGAKVLEDILGLKHLTPIDPRKGA
jgi:amidase